MSKTRTDMPKARADKSKPTRGDNISGCVCSSRGAFLPCRRARYRPNPCVWVFVVAAIVTLATAASFWQDLAEAPDRGLQSVMGKLGKRGF